MSQDRAKKAAGEKAASLIQDHTIVGLGSGSTSAYFIQALILRYQQGLKIQTVASSSGSYALAKRGNLPLIDINDAPMIHITVDGADEIDPHKRMIKGGGGAHLREKILAASSKELLIIIDESKRVAHLGAQKLPVEVLFYGSPSTRSRIEEAGYRGQWRLNPDGSLFLTDSGNLLFDIRFDAPIHFPEKEEMRLLQIAGVVDTGFFFNLAGRVIVGKSDGTAELL